MSTLISLNQHHIKDCSFTLQLEIIDSKFHHKSDFFGLIVPSKLQDYTKTFNFGGEITEKNKFKVGNLPLKLG